MALFKTKGIVLHYLKYGETSIITKMLTEEFGLQSYIINGVRSKKPRFSVSLFQPLTPLNMVVYKKKNATLNRISEISLNAPISNIQSNIQKSGIALFVAEILNRAIREEMEDRPMFDFIYNSIHALECQNAGYQNFHLLFLIKLSAFLGFAPQTGREILSQASQLYEPDQPEEAAALDRLLNANFHDNLPLTTAIRRRLLERLVSFYQEHIENFGRVRSLEVLKEVME